jgi:hypothetical protein
MATIGKLYTLITGRHGNNRQAAEEGKSPINTA